MKRAFYCCIAVVFIGSLSVVAQISPEHQEKIERLTRDIEALLAANADLQRKISNLNEELARVREAQSRSANDLAVQGLREDLRRLAEKIQEVDRKRIDDKEVVVNELGKIERALKAGITSGSGSRPSGNSRPSDSSSTAARPQNGIKYKVQPGDTLLAIIGDANRQFKDKGWKPITLDQVRAANPGLVPEKMKVGDEIFLPIPGQ